MSSATLQFKISGPWTIHQVTCSNHSQQLLIKGMIKINLSPSFTFKLNKLLHLKKKLKQLLEIKQQSNWQWVTNSSFSHVRVMLKVSRINISHLRNKGLDLIILAWKIDKIKKAQTPTTDSRKVKGNYFYLHPAMHYWVDN